MKFRVFFLALILAFGFLGCTRNVSKETTIRFQLPSSLNNKSQGALSLDNAFFVSFNVSGGETRIVKTWDEHSGSSGVRPTEYTMSLPKGKSLLFQYLAVSEDANGSLLFYYGDSRKTLQDDVENINITLSAIGGGAREAKMSGRVMSATSTTGKVAIKFRPPTGETPMTLMYTYIFGGWINDYILIDHPDAAFDYTMVTNNVENPNPFLTNLKPSSALLAPSPHVLKVKVPFGFYGHGNGDFEVAPARHLFFGYYGLGGVGKSACYSNSPGSLGGYYQADKTTLVNWIANPTLTQAGRLEGGVPSGSCTGDQYENFLMFDHNFFADNDGVNYRGPYRRHAQADQYSMFKSTWNEGSGTMVIEWDYLPGTGGSNGLTGTAVYYKLDFNSSQGNNDVLDDKDTEFSCQDLKTKMGFNEKLVTYSSKIVTIPGVTRTMLENNKVKVALCPYRGTEFFADGIESYGFHHLTMQLPTFKIVGATPGSALFRSNNVLNVPGLKFKKSAIDAYYHLMIAHGDGSVSPSDINAISFTTDGGTSWYSLGPANPSFVVNGNTVAGYSLGSGGLLSQFGDGNSDTTVQFRMLLANPTAYGANAPSEILSEPVTFVGNTNCSSSTYKMKRLADNSEFDSTTFLNDFFGPGVVNATKLKHTYKMVYDGCADVIAPVDRFMMAPANNCFNPLVDVNFEQSKPFTFTVDPKDSAGLNCSLGGVTVMAAIPADDSTPLGLTRIFGSATLTHSTDWDTMVPIAADAPLANPGNFNLKIKKWMTTTGKSLTGQFFRTNDDYRFTHGTTTASPTSVTWTSVASQFAAANNLANFTITSGAPDNKAHLQVADSGGKKGGFLMLNHSIDEEIAHVTSEAFMGGSPLIVSKNGSNYKISFIRSGPGGTLEGQQLKTLTGAASLISGVSDPVVVTTVPIFSQNASYLFMGVGNKFYFGAVRHDNLNADYWSSAFTVAAGGKALNVFDPHSAGVMSAIVAETGLSQTMYRFYIPSFNESNNTWGGASAPYGQGNTSTSTNIVDVAHCGDNVYAAVGFSGDPTEWQAKIWGANGAVNHDFLSGPSQVTADYNKAFCMKHLVGPNETYIVGFYSTTQDSATAVPRFMIRNTSGISLCGGNLSPSAYLSMSAPSSIQSGIGPIGGITVRASPSGPPKIVVASRGTSQTKFYEFSENMCVGGSIPAFEPATLRGTFKAVDVFTGAINFMGRMFFYGKNGQALELE